MPAFYCPTLDPAQELGFMLIYVYFLLIFLLSQASWCAILRICVCYRYLFQGNVTASHCFLDSKLPKQKRLPISVWFAGTLSTCHSYLWPQLNCFKQSPAFCPVLPSLHFWFLFSVKRSFRCSQSLLLC